MYLELGKQSLLRQGNSLSFQKTEFVISFELRIWPEWSFQIEVDFS